MRGSGVFFNILRTFLERKPVLSVEVLGKNAYFWRMLKVAGHPNAEILELSGFDHGGMASPAFPHLLKFVKR